MATAPVATVVIVATARRAATEIGQAPRAAIALRAPPATLASLPRSARRPPAARRPDDPARVRVWYAEQVHDGDWRSEFIRRVQGRRVFLTIDVDGLDPAIVPATGTPEPDGLTWRETLDIVRTLSQHATVAGLDCVELAPAAGQHAADFAVAKLLYKTISYVMRGA